MQVQQPLWFLRPFERNKTMIPNGLSAFPLTPADANGTVDVPGVRKLVARLAVVKVDSIGLLGSTGNYAYFTRAERRRALDAALDVSNGVPIVVGVGALRTDEAVRLAQDAKAAGAAAGLLAPVSYTPLSDDEVFEHYRTVAEQSHLPLCIYDNPGTTHFTFKPSLVGRLSSLPGIIALKSPAPAPDAIDQHLLALREATSPGFSLGYSGDWICSEAHIAGSSVWYSVLAGTCPEICLQIVRAVQSGDMGEARRIDAQLQPLWSLFREYSSLRVVFAISSVLGLTSHEPPRPILPLDASVRARVETVIEQLKLQ
jgi:4-hydroxy-tetrahydrodipicolinate synthase